MRLLITSSVFCAGVLFGTVYSSIPAVAQDSPYPFDIGETISLRYEAAGSRQCNVEAIRGPFVKCKRDRDEEWYNLNTTLQIVKSLK